MWRTLEDFVRESNRIEGINRDPTPTEIEAHRWFLALAEPCVIDLETFVDMIQPSAKLRRHTGLNVRVGNHYPPPGGHGIEVRLTALLEDATLASASAYGTHLSYETLHPFTDGNGRSGRVLWLWMVGGKAPLGFLHEFYYETLRAHQ